MPHYERTGNEKTFASGVLIDAATEKLEEIIIEKSKRHEERSLLTEEQNRSKNTNDSRQNSKNENNEKSSLNDSHSEAVISHEREVLARALLAKYFLERSVQKLEAIVENGHKRRFMIFDAVTNQKCRMSLFDFELRAEVAATREIKKLKITDVAKIAELRKNFLDTELSQNAAGIKQRALKSGQLFDQTKQIFARNLENIGPGSSKHDGLISILSREIYEKIENRQVESPCEHSREKYDQTRHHGPVKTDQIFDRAPQLHSLNPDRSSDTNIHLR